MIADPTTQPSTLAPGLVALRAPRTIVTAQRARRAA